MLYLYHGSTSVCSAKVRLVLEEKGLEWDGRVLDLQKGDQHHPDYTALNPNAVVPTLVDGKDVIIESTVICEYLEDKFPSPPLTPQDPPLRARMREWTKHVDEKLHAATGLLTFATANRKVLLQKTPEDLAEHLNRIPDLVYRERQRVAIEMGLDAPDVAVAATTISNTWARMNSALGEARFLAGDRFSLADAALLPYINRFSVLGLEECWRERLPNLQGWWANAQRRPTFEPALKSLVSPKDAKRFHVDSDSILKKFGSPRALAT